MLKRIIHLSDLHIGYKGLGERFRHVASELASLKDDKLDEYVIVITGDLVDDATKSEQYLEAKASIDFLKGLGFKHVLVVPGNHDYGTGNKADECFVDLFKKTFFDDTSISYPKVDIIGGIAFFGLDSMAEEIWGTDRHFSQGELGKGKPGFPRQLDRLKDELEKDEVKKLKKVVYLHHHPFDAFPLHELKDAMALKQIIAKKVDALLYGHNHRGRAGIGKWGIPLAFESGTTTGKPRPEILDVLPFFKISTDIRIIKLDAKPNEKPYYTLNFL